MKMKLLVAVLAAGVAQAANAGDQDFKLVNKTGYDIREVYVSATRSNRWGRDVLGTGMLHNGNQIPIKFAPTNKTCVYDIRVVYTDDDTAEWTEFDLCTISRISITYSRAGEPTATYE